MRWSACLKAFPSPAEPFLKNRMRGFVHLKKFLSTAEQNELLALCQELSFSHHAFRRRFYGPIIEPLQELADRALAKADDPLLQKVEYSHFIALHYAIVDPPPKYYIPWHSDNGDNDGNADYPIVSFSLGDTCVLQVSPEKPKMINGILQAQEVVYESGDVVIWGGPARGLWHAIQRIEPFTSPIMFDRSRVPMGRYNLTLRHTPQLVGKEELFREIPTDLGRNNRFYKLAI